MKKKCVNAVYVSIFSGISIILCASQAYAVPFDGLSAASAGISAKQILNDNSASTNGTYWIDPDGSGGDSAFQIYADMTAAGGGWTLGLNSMNTDASSTTDMVSNTGTVGLNTGHTRNMMNLAINREAEIRHRFIDTGGNVLFDGYYSGYYHGTLGVEAAWTTIAGDFNFATPGYGLAGIAGMDWSTGSNDVDDWSGGNCADYYSLPWYYAGCWSAIPTNFQSDHATNTPIYYTEAGNPLALGQYSIYVRELVTPDATNSIPEPTTLALMGLGLAGLSFRKKKQA